ncbi:AAA family ATPase [Azorhizobium sp. AG788]|uniref:trifunctional serine/threonine-protein kinase/ATP-binding protein/sensor histidine kinase n=1 Tax=Azorhizobium sp. AG788 TaxID=2183897 RepID=UPI0031399B11
MDIDWFNRCTRELLHAEHDISHHRLVDPSTSKTWLAASARWKSVDACRRLENEHTLGQELDASWAHTPVAMIRGNTDLILIFEDRGGVSLQSAASAAPMDIARFMSVAVEATAALARTHACKVLHRYIRAASLLDDGNGRVRLASFGYGVLTGGDAIWSDLPLDPDALAHMAPEQARRDLPYGDERSDLYSLGVTFYELLTGQYPLKADSPAGWLHAHVAVQPARPSILREEIPETLGAIILKLIAKDPAHRYQSATALQADLVRCQMDWRAMGRIEPFDLGSAEPQTLFRGLQNLFGRAAETQTLADAFRRVVDSGQSEIAFLSGAAGAGKSKLVEGVARIIGSAEAQFAAGKSDQMQRDIPYAPIAQAIRSLAARLLAGDPAELNAAREGMLARLAGQGEMIAELVPEMELIIGRSAPLADGPMQQAQTRVHRAIQQTISAFVDEGTPLILFLDDLQWADDSTIAFLKTFAADPPRNVLLVAAYRDQEAGHLVGPGGVLPALRRSALDVTDIEVGALSVSDVAQMIARGMNDEEANVAPLARAVYEKTAGNPFFVNQLLRTLVDDNVILYAADRRSWTWDGAEVARYDHADNVIDLMVRRLERLPEDGRDILRHLACIGPRCDEALLSLVTGIGPDQIRRKAQPLFEAGLLLRDGAGYIFSHDRILEAAYALTAPAERPHAHARIARIMADIWQDQVYDFAFEIANQIERAAKTELTPSVRVSFVMALITAARRAKNSAAIDQASNYLVIARGLSDESWWSDHYAVAYALKKLQCECLIAQAQLGDASRETDLLLTHATSNIDKAAAYRLKATLHTLRSDYEGAIIAALAGLDLLGIHLGREPSRAQLDQAYEAVRAALAGRTISELGQLATTDNTEAEAAMALLSTLIASFFLNDGLSFLHLAKIVELTLQHGSTPASAYGLAWFGVFIASLYSAYEDGFAYGQAALKLVERHRYQAERTAALVAMDQVSPWTQPLSYALTHAREAVAAGYVMGDLGMACYACNHIVSDLLVMGVPLGLVEQEIEHGLALTRQIQYKDIEIIIDSQKQHVRSLIEAYTKHDYRRNYHRVTKDNQIHVESDSSPTIFWTHLYAGMTATFYRDFDDASLRLMTAYELSWSTPAHINVCDCYLFSVLASAHDSDASTNALGAIDKISARREKIAEWSALNPATFRNKLLFVDAELARLRGNGLLALKCYEQSASAAATGGFIHEQALAHEFAGMLCEANGLQLSGQQHFRSAHDCYRRWGATGKVRHLEALHPFLTSEPVQDTATSANGGQIALDMEIGMKTAQALSEETTLDRLLETLMSNMIVHAGAQYGLLLLMREGKPVIEAVGRIVGSDVIVDIAQSAPTARSIPISVLNSVVKSKQPLSLADAQTDAPEIHRAGLAERSVRSLLCLPLMRHGVLIGILYLENNLAPGVFSASRISMIEILAPQAAISIETARLYSELVAENARRAQTETALRNARADLARTSNLTIMGTLAASIAHEINQPLASMVSHAGAGLRWLKRETPDISEAIQGLESIQKVGLGAAEIVRALRALAKQAPAELQPTLMDKLISNVLRLTEAEILEHEVRVTTDLAVDPTPVFADPVQLQQVILNLVTNAVDAMTLVPVERRELTITSRLEDMNIVVSVRDNGSGITPDAQKRIFEAFYTTKSKGMGMGLAICRSIMQAHSGSLDVSSAEGGGTTFVFKLPIDAGE